MKQNMDDLVKCTNGSGFKINTQNYMYFEKKDEIYLSSDLLSKIRDYGWLSTIYRTYMGSYLCGSFMKNKWEENPFSFKFENCINLLCRRFDNIATCRDYNLVEWVVRDSGKVYTIELFGVNYPDDDPETIITLEWNSKIGRFKGNMGSNERICGVFLNILSDLSKLPFPVDMLDVSIAGEKFSEEGYYHNGEGVNSYLSDMETGFWDSSMLTYGVSTISALNDFVKYDYLRGKTSILIVK